jgi:tripartite-type tricarboxylate transporter receptor subunit TctC
MLRYGSEKGEHLMRSIMKHLAAWTALGGVIAGIIPASAAGYPDRAVKVIVPFAAGGPTDVMARLISSSNFMSRTMPAPAVISA